METTTEIRVRYAETDQMGIVHHSHYVVWVELGRSDFLRRLGRSYSEWEAQGVRLVVSGVELKYRAPAHYDELIQVRCWIKEAGRRHLVFGYAVERDGVLLAEGESRHHAAGHDGRARVIPGPMLELLKGGISRD